jgi:GGDEF domain-containing protein
LPSWETMTCIAVGVSVLAACLLAVSIMLALRLRRGGDAAERSRREVEQAWEEVRRERAGSTRARSELHWLRNLAEVGASDSIESALRRVLESAAGLGESAAAVLVLPQPDGEPIVATFGLSAAESSQEVLGLPPGGGDARAVTLVYKYTTEEAERDEFRLSGGLALPILDHNGESLGTLALFWRRVEREVTEEELEQLEGLAGALGPSLTNAFRFDELRRAVDLDGTGLPGRRTLREALVVECARARRYLHPLSLLLLRAKDEADSLRATAERLPTDVRTPDLVHHLGEGRFVVVLPESSMGDAERIAKRLRVALGEAGTPAATVELESEDDAVSFLERAEAALAGAEILAATGRNLPKTVEPGG